MVCRLPGSSVHGILQARILEWVAISFSSFIGISVLKSLLPRSLTFYKRSEHKPKNDFIIFQFHGLCFLKVYTYTIFRSRLCTYPIHFPNTKNNSCVLEIVSKLFSGRLSVYFILCSASLSCLLYNLMDYSPPGSSVHGSSQAKILEWVAISFSKGSSWPGTELPSPTLTGRFFSTSPQPCLKTVNMIFGCNCLSHHVLKM